MDCTFCNKPAYIKLIGNETNSAVIMNSIEVMVCHDHARELLQMAYKTDGGILKVPRGLFKVLKERLEAV